MPRRFCRAQGGPDAAALHPLLCNAVWALREVLWAVRAPLRCCCDHQACWHGRAELTPLPFPLGVQDGRSARCLRAGDRAGS